MEMEFKKIKLIKDTKAHIEYKRKEADGKTKSIAEDSDGAPHPDFTAAMARLAVHFAILTGYVRPSDVKNLDSYTGPEGLLDSFKVSGFSIGGDDEDQGLVISGHRILPSSGKAIILNSPFTRFNEDDKTRYKFMDELIEELDQVKIEAKKFVGGKFAADPQKALDFTPKNELSEATR